MLRKKRNISAHNQSGFALVWAAILTVVAGMAAVSYINFLEVQQTWGTVEQTQDTIEDVIGALTAFEMANGHLPCPASFIARANTKEFATSRNLIDTPPSNVCAGTDAGNDGAHTINTSNIRIGAVPTRTLGLPDDKGRDQWGNRIVYAVTKSKTLTATYGTTLGIIVVQDETGATIRSNQDHHVFTHGPDKLGAYQFMNGTLVRACTGTALETENCDNNDVVFLKPDYPF